MSLSYENVNLQSGTFSRWPATATDQLAVRPMHDDFRRYRVRCDSYRIQRRIAEVLRYNNKRLILQLRNLTACRSMACMLPWVSRRCLGL